MKQDIKLTKEDIDFSNLSKDRRFEDLTGKTFGSLKILGTYKKINKTLYWVAECSCGNIIGTTRSKVKDRGKTSCVDCAELKLKDKILTPIDIKLEDLYRSRDDITVVSMQGSAWSSYWDVQCNNCSGEYSRRYRDLIRGVSGCECSKNKRKDLDNKIEVVNNYCKEKNFTFIGWDTSNRIRVKFLCNTHNKHVESDYNNVKKGKNCCRDCYLENKIQYNLKTKEDFISDAVKVHGLGSFDYSLVNYINSDTKVEIVCNNCLDINLQTPAGHLSGRGCKGCSKTGYKPNEPCWLYIMRLEGLCEEWYKVGITKNLKQRLYNVSLGSWYDIEYLQFNLFNYGWQAKSIEKKILNSLRSKGTINSKYHKEGNSEIFKPYELGKVLRMFEEELEKFKY